MTEIFKKYGGLKIFWHPDKLESFKDWKITPPIYVRVKPTNKCNHNCFYCSYAPEFKYILSEKMNKSDEIPKEKMLEILDDFKEMGVKAVTYSGGGEPLIHPNIIEIIKKTLDNNIDLSIITNGQEIKGKKAEILKNAKWVRISLDSIDSETFYKIRRRPKNMFDELIENIKNFVEIKDKCELGINFVVNEYNANKVYDAIKFFKELKVNHIKLTPLYTPRSFEEYHSPFKNIVIRQIKKAKEDFPELDIYDTYENDFLLSSVHERKYKRCFIMQTVPVIGADSNVYFCHDKSYSNDGILGSIKNKRFKELWFSQEAAKIFKSFNPQQKCKHHCTYDARNILINDILDNFGEHVNFI